MPVLIVNQAHRLSAVDLIWRTFDRPFTTEADYKLLIDEVAEKLAQGRLVIMRRRENEIEVISRK